MAQQQITVYRTPVRWANPVSIWQARMLGWLHGKAINRDNGHVTYGYPQIGMRAKYQGYAFPPQLFFGFSAKRVAAGAIRANAAALPSTKSPASLLASPLQQAMSTVSIAQLGGGPF